MRRFFVPDKEKCEAFYGHKKMCWSKTAQRAKPDCGFAEAEPPKGAKRIQSCYTTYYPYFIISKHFISYIFYLCLKYYYMTHCPTFAYRFWGISNYFIISFCIFVYNFYPKFFRNNIFWMNF